MLVDRSGLLSLTAPEMTILVGSTRALSANYVGSDWHGVAERLRDGDRTYPTLSPPQATGHVRRLGREGEHPDSKDDVAPIQESGRRTVVMPDSGKTNTPRMGRFRISLCSLYRVGRSVSYDDIRRIRRRVVDIVR